MLRRLAIAVAPWITSRRPSLAAGLIHAAAEQAGVEVSTEYLGFDLIGIVGGDVYETLSGDPRYFPLCEHLFAADIFGAAALDSDAFLSDARQPWLAPPRRRGSHVTLRTDTLVALRDQIVPLLLDRWTRRLLALDADVVGFTCTFNQVLPSLAIARRLKRARPDILTLFGGACVHGAMGEAYAQAFPELMDWVFTGEADLAFPEWLAAAREGAEREIPGVIHGGRTVSVRAEQVRDLDALPVPNHDAYFAERSRLEGTGCKLQAMEAMPFEASRGCWWGARSHCVFCGLNGESMAFRTKSGARVAHELRALRDRHGVTHFAAADNIMRHDAVAELLPHLREVGDLRLFFEVKANLKRDDLAAMAASGIGAVQPGIESFADGVLRIMRKGVSAAQNVALLTMLAEFGIAPLFNILVGFVGETEEDYDQLLHVVRQLYHLPPPMVDFAIPVQLHRFSPMFDRAAELGITDVRAAWSYRHIIPPSVLAPEAFAYFFEHAQPETLPGMRRRGEIDRALEEWSSCTVRRSAVVLDDQVVLRTCEGGETSDQPLTPIESLAFLLCDAPTTVGQLGDRLAAMMRKPFTHAPELVEQLCRVGAVVRCNDRIVGCIPHALPHGSDEHMAMIGRVGEFTRGDLFTHR